MLGDDGREAILIDVEDEETNGIEVECGKFTAGGTKKWLYSVNFMHETDKSVNAKDARRVRKEKLDAKRRERRWKPRGCTHTPHKTFAGTRSWKIRAFYIVSLSVYFLRRKKRKNRGKIGGKEREKERERERGRETFVSVSKKRIFFSFTLHFLARAYARICARI